MQIVEQAILMPGQCAVTGSGDGPFLDTMREDDRGYRIYISVFFLMEAAAVMGMAPSEALDRVCAQLASLEGAVAERDAMKAELDALRTAVRRTLAQGAVVKSREVGGGDVTEWGLRATPGTKVPNLEAD